MIFSNSKKLEYKDFKARKIPEYNIFAHYPPGLSKVLQEFYQAINKTIQTLERTRSQLREIKLCDKYSLN